MTTVVVWRMDGLMDGWMHCSAHYAHRDVLFIFFTQNSAACAVLRRRARDGKKQTKTENRKKLLLLPTDVASYYYLSPGMKWPVVAACRALAPLVRCCGGTYVAWRNIAVQLQRERT